MAGERVLIIDDDPDFVESTAITLESEGFVVDSARDGKEGLAKLHAQGADLILLDVMMSSLLEGVWVSEELAKEPKLKQIPILMISSIPNTEYIGQFPSEGPLHIDNFLTKPVPAAELIATVKRLLAAKTRTKA